MKKRIKIIYSGFTLIELLVVIGIISLISSITIVGLENGREKGKAGQVTANANAFKFAAQLYFDDMGFFPPDVGRGWDPGFMKSMPWNPDTEDTIIPECGHCPSNWIQVVSQKWRGPYLGKWPGKTPWNGTYDFNYWSVGAIRYGCNVPPGMYIGFQRDYLDENPVNEFAEQSMLNQLIDGDGCLNGEVQVLIQSI